MQTHQGTTSFFTGLYGSSMILFKQRVDQLIQSHAYSFESYRPPKKMRVGVLPIVAQYENLAKHAEILFENSERRTDLEKWHEKLIDALFKGINNVAESPNSKSPPAVVRFENFHQLYLSLSALKIDCLDARRKQARKIYQSSIDDYVKEYMGRPLEKIHVFFEQIEKALENGIRPEEIGYQQQFSRLELKKVVQAYPGKEVKKGLENLYKKVEKHLIDGSSLIEVCDVEVYQMMKIMKDSVSFKEQNQLFVNDTSQIYDNQYFNLNLNQKNKCPVLISVQTYSKPYKDKNCDSIICENYKEKKKLQLWNKSSDLKNLTTATFDENEKKRWKKNFFPKSKNSTLSLHITPISINSPASDFNSDKNYDRFKKEKARLIKKKEKTKQNSTASKCVIQYPFEFPRQQNDKVQEPKVSQFKAFQRLFNPNQKLKNSFQNNKSFAAHVVLQNLPHHNTVATQCRSFQQMAKFSPNFRQLCSSLFLRAIGNTMIRNNFLRSSGIRLSQSTRNGMFFKKCDVKISYK
uniref:Exocyst complex component Sec3 C-terminal domain-containing protein n=2 Tax=Panagrolaimus sp. PS1159 TaxID=55785 RepID=A0AC35GMD8_9BILA